MQDERSPQERLDATAAMLKRLAELEVAIDASEDERAKSHTQLEVARTRADIFEWIAYDPRHIDEPVSRSAVAQGTQLDKSGIDLLAARTGSQSTPGENPDSIRAWALIQARRICEKQADPNFDVQFALAECLFKLRETDLADAAFDHAEHLAHDMVGEQHEQRTVASLQESLLICHVRLLQLHEREEAKATSERRQVRQASREAREAVGQLRQGRVTVFSQVQRRNITQESSRGRSARSSTRATSSKRPR